MDQLRCCNRAWRWRHFERRVWFKHLWRYLFKRDTARVGLVAHTGGAAAYQRAAHEHVPAAPGTARRISFCNAPRFLSSHNLLLRFYAAAKRFLVMVWLRNHGGRRFNSAGVWTFLHMVRLRRRHHQANGRRLLLAFKTVAIGTFRGAFRAWRRRFWLSSAAVAELLAASTLLCCTRRNALSSYLPLLSPCCHALAYPRDGERRTER